MPLRKNLTFTPPSGIITLSRQLYCLRFFRPLPKGRLWYNIHLLESRNRWRTKRKRRNFTPEFKAKVVLEALCGESSQAELCRRHTLSDEQLSMKSRFQKDLRPKPKTLQNALNTQKPKIRVIRLICENPRFRQLTIPSTHFAPKSTV